MKLSSKKFKGKVFRHISKGRDVFDIAGSLIYGGRWNVTGEFGATYTSLTISGAGNESVRAQKKANEQSRRIKEAREMVEIQVDLSRVFDFTADANLKLFRVTKRDLVGDDPAICRLLATILYRAGFEGVLVPSAVGPETNLVIFPDNLKKSSILKEVQREKFL